MGEPDFVLITKEEDMKNSVLRLAIEVKTQWVLPSNDLVAQFNREVETQKKNKKRKETVWFAQTIVIYKIVLLGR